MKILAFNKKMEHYQCSHLIRERSAIEGRKDNDISLDGANVINFSGNDYLGIATDPRVVRALQQGADKYGFGSSASAHTSGYHYVHKKLEEKFAAFLNREKALLFNSGYLANLGVITDV